MNTYQSYIQTRDAMNPVLSPIQDLLDGAGAAPAAPSQAPAPAAAAGEGFMDIFSGGGAEAPAMVPRQQLELRSILIGREVSLVLQRPSEKVKPEPQKQLQIQFQKVFGAVGYEISAAKYEI